MISRKAVRIFGKWIGARANFEVEIQITAETTREACVDLVAQMQLMLRCSQEIDEIWRTYFISQQNLI
jgi:hypothetical protein